MILYQFQLLKILFRHRITPFSYFHIVTIQYPHSYFTLQILFIFSISYFYWFITVYFIENIKKDISYCYEMPLNHCFPYFRVNFVTMRVLNSYEASKMPCINPCKNCNTNKFVMQMDLCLLPLHFLTVIKANLVRYVNAQTC